MNESPIPSSVFFVKISVPVRVLVNVQIVSAPSWTIMLPIVLPFEQEDVTTHPAGTGDSETL